MMQQMPVMQVQPTNAVVRNDDDGQFVPCCLSEDDSDSDGGHGDGCECALCTHGDGGTGAGHKVIQQMKELDEFLVGKISDEEIYKIQSELFRKHVEEPLKKQGVDCPTVTSEMCRDHFQKHHLNVKRMIAKEILFVDSIQKKVRKSSIMERNNVSGYTKINNNGVRQWISLSKHKLDLIKYYQGPLSKLGDGQTKTIQPQTFT